jgi:hypothetical protein
MRVAAAETQQAQDVHETFLIFPCSVLLEFIALPLHEKLQGPL